MRIKPRKNLAILNRIHIDKNNAVCYVQFVDKNANLVGEPFYRCFFVSRTLEGWREDPKTRELTGVYEEKILFYDYELNEFSSLKNFARYIKLQNTANGLMNL